MPGKKFHFEGTFNWKGEIHTLSAEAVSYAQAFRHMTHGLSRKLNTSASTVRSYFASDDYKRSFHHDITKK